MRRAVIGLSIVLGIILGVAGTIFVQWCLAPERMAALPSPDGDWEFIVERQNSFFGAPYRIFRICSRDDGEPVDGPIYIQHEYASGGPDMSSMQTYWRGNTAVADFGYFRLERTIAPGSNQWEWKSSPVPPATSRPATQP